MEFNDPPSVEGLFAWLDEKLKLAIENQDYEEAIEIKKAIKDFKTNAGIQPLDD